MDDPLEEYYAALQLSGDDEVRHLAARDRSRVLREIRWNNERLAEHRHSYDIPALADHLVADHGFTDGIVAYARTSIRGWDLLDDLHRHSHIHDSPRSHDLQNDKETES